MKQKERGDGAEEALKKKENDGETKEKEAE
jgi:hypothetical protein